MTKSVIISSGSYQPAKIVTNEDLSKIVETTDEWIVERTGIKERRIAAEGELTSDLAFQACEQAIKKAGIDRNSIDLIIVATTTPDRTFPSTAAILQSKLGIGEKAFAFDVQAVCSGFIYATNIADNFIKTGQVKTALVVGCDTLSRIVDWTDRNTCVLFGDGAGAIIMQASEGENGILSSSLHCDGKLADILNTTGGVSLNQKAGFIFMEGKEVFKIAVNKMADCVLESLQKCKLTTADIDWLIPHQANLRILTGAAQKLSIPMEKVVVTLEKQANTSAATIPLAIDHVFDKIKKNDVVVLEALGGGITWGSIVIKW